PGSGRLPSGGQCAASVMTSHPADGPSATVTSSVSTRPSLASVCLSPEARRRTGSARSRVEDEPAAGARSFVLRTYRRRSRASSPFYRWGPTLRTPLVRRRTTWSQLEAFTRRSFIGGLALVVFTGDAVGSRSQGVTTDGTHWYFSSSNGLEITDMQYDTILTASPAIPPELASPSSLAYKGLNRIGDMDVACGNLYIALDSSTPDPGNPDEYQYKYDTPVFAI